MSDSSNPEPEPVENEGVILTYTREPGLTTPYCAQVWNKFASLQAIDTFKTAQEAYDFCVDKGATTIDCQIYAD